MEFIINLNNDKLDISYKITRDNVTNSTGNNKVISLNLIISQIHLLIGAFRNGNNDATLEYFLYTGSENYGKSSNIVIEDRTIKINCKAWAMFTYWYQ